MSDQAFILSENELILASEHVAWNVTYVNVHLLGETSLKDVALLNKFLHTCLVHSRERVVRWETSVEIIKL
jgi:hypothetical protein